MSQRPRYHVTRRPDGDWQVKQEGASRAFAVADTKAEAVDRGREIGRAAGGQLVVHGSNSRIQTEHTYGSDPYPPKG